MTAAGDPRSALPTSMRNPVRLAILSSLRQVESGDFAALRQAFEMTTQEMSRQLALLEREQLIQVRKARRGRQAITQARLSDQGRVTFEEYLVNFRRISDGIPI